MKNTKKIISKILIYFALILGVLFCLVPLYWMIRSSLMNTVEVFMMPPRWIPSKFMWENYQEVFDTLPFGKYFLNSFIVTGGCVVGTMLPVPSVHMDWQELNGEAEMWYLPASSAV